MSKKHRQKTTSSKKQNNPTLSKKIWIYPAIVTALLLIGWAGFSLTNRQIKHSKQAMEKDLAMIHAQEMGFYNLALRSPTALNLYNWYMAHRVRSVIASEGNNKFALVPQEKKPENFFFVAECRQQDLCFQKFGGPKGVIGLYRDEINTLFLLETNNNFEPLYQSLVLAHEVKHAYIRKEKIQFLNIKAEEYECYLVFSQIVNELTNNSLQRGLQKQLDRYLLTGRNDADGFINSLSIPELEAEIKITGVAQNWLDIIIYAIEIWANTVHPNNKQEAINQVLVNIKLEP